MGLMVGFSWALTAWCGRRTGRTWPANAGGAPFFGFIFDPAGQGQVDSVDLRGGSRAPRRFIGWQTFFDFGDGQMRPNKRIDTNLSTPLFNLPLGAIASGTPPTSLRSATCCATSPGRSRRGRPSPGPWASRR